MALNHFVLEYVKMSFDPGALYFEKKAAWATDRVDVFFVDEDKV
jgi:hypothetical protein